MNEAIGRASVGGLNQLQAARSSQIVGQTARLMDGCKVLREVVSQLESRLEAVLHPEPQSPADSSTIVVDNLVDHARVLRDVSDGVDYTITRLHNIMGRLEL